MKLYIYFYIPLIIKLTIVLTTILFLGVFIFFVFSENLLLLLLLWSPYWSAHLLITFCSLKKKEFQNNRCQIVKYILKRAQIPTCLSKSGLSAPEAASFKHICSDEY